MMNLMKTLTLLGLISCTSSVMVACSEHKDNRERKNEAKTDHIWKHQTDTLKTSKDAAKKLQESLNQHQKNIDQSN